jgi:ABC-type proline/glycine betaine transport system substrate-binding protein
MQDALTALEQNYMTLNQQLAMLSLNCTPDQKTALMNQVVAARSAYWSCVNKAFHDDDPQVVSLASQLNAANQQLSNAVQQMGDIGATLTQITQAVTLASSLAALVISP